MYVPVLYVCVCVRKPLTSCLRPHHSECPWFFPDVSGDSSGSPCTAHSLRGKRRGRNGNAAAPFLVWCRSHLQIGTPWIAHENVPQFDVEMATSVLGSVYEVAARITTRPEHCGVGAVERERMWLIFRHRERTQLLHGPARLYDSLTRTLSAFQVPPAAIWREDDIAEFANEVRQYGMGTKRLHPSCKPERIEKIAAARNFQPCLTEWEAKNVQKYNELWSEKCPGYPLCGERACVVSPQESSSPRENLGIEGDLSVRGFACGASGRR